MATFQNNLFKAPLMYHNLGTPENAIMISRVGQFVPQRDLFKYSEKQTQTLQYQIPQSLTCYIFHSPSYFLIFQINVNTDFIII